MEKSAGVSAAPPSGPPATAVALPAAPASTGADIAAAFDSAVDAGAGGRPPSPRRKDGKGPPATTSTPLRTPTPTPVLAAASMLRGAAASAPPAFHSNSDAAGAGRVPSPRRIREHSPRLHYDHDSDNSTASASEDGGGDASYASPLPRARPSPNIRTSSIKPIRTRPMDVSSRDAAAASSELRTKCRPVDQKGPTWYGALKTRSSFSAPSLITMPRKAGSLLHFRTHKLSAQADFWATHS
jgi:hypothetical protein